MTDLFHIYGGDLAVSAAGDLALATADESGQQRLYRRLGTNPALLDSAGNVVATGDYLAHQDYGAGVGRRVGAPVDVAGTTQTIEAQVRMESAVAKSPPPQVTVTPMQDALSAQIQYTDAETLTTQVIAFDINI